MAIQKRRVQLSKKKKKWYNIHASKEYGSVCLGESFVSEPNKLIGKRLRVDLFTISKTRNPNVRIVFEVKTVADEKAIAEPIGYHVLPVFLKRFIKKGKTKSDHSYVFITKDSVKCIIKIFMVTRSKVQSSVSKVLKVELTKLLESEFKKKTFEELLSSMIDYTIQKSLKTSLSKIHPLNALEVRVFYKNSR